jgi:hypothetical protein
MYELAEHQNLRKLQEEIRGEAAMEHLSGMAHEDHETRPYLVRDLSWELARYLDRELPG